MRDAERLAEEREFRAKSAESQMMAADVRAIHAEGNASKLRKELEATQLLLRGEEALVRGLRKEWAATKRWLEAARAWADARCSELEDQVDDLGSRLEGMTFRAENAEAGWSDVESLLETAESERDEAEGKVDEYAGQLFTLEEALRDERRVCEAWRLIAGLRKRRADAAEAAHELTKQDRDHWYRLWAALYDGTGGWWETVTGPEGYCPESYGGTDTE